MDFTCEDGIFRTTVTTIVEEGFTAALKLLAPKEKKVSIPSLAQGETVEFTKIVKDQHFTQGPSHYNDASIIKALEERGIGRPSTYSPIISVLMDRYYVIRKNKKLMATMLGKIINDLLTSTFPEIIDVNFTASIEKKLDEVETSGEPWSSMIASFYAPFNEKVEYVMENLESIKGVLDEPTDFTCEKCGKPMVKKLGRYGFFLACTGFPECMSSRAVPLAPCPRPGCSGHIVAKKKSKGRGKVFYGCTNFPECDFITYFQPTEHKCPKCGWFMVERTDKKRGDYRSCVNPECGYIPGQEDEEAG